MVDCKNKTNELNPWIISHYIVPFLRPCKGEIHSNLLSFCVYCAVLVQLSAPMPLVG